MKLTDQEKENIAAWIDQAERNTQILRVCELIEFERNAKAALRLITKTAAETGVI